MLLALRSVLLASLGVTRFARCYSLRSVLLASLGVTRFARPVYCCNPIDFYHSIIDTDSVSQSVPSPSFQFCYRGHFQDKPPGLGGLILRSQVRTRYHMYTSNNTEKTKKTFIPTKMATSLAEEPRHKLKSRTQSATSKYTRNPTVARLPPPKTFETPNYQGTSRVEWVSLLAGREGPGHPPEPRDLKTC